MRLSFLPLLQVQRDLYALPRGMERFREYIKTMTEASTGDLALPLVAMNPMGKDHVPALIDEYIALGAEQIARDAIAVWRMAASATATALALQSKEYKVCLVVSVPVRRSGCGRTRLSAAGPHRARRPGTRPERRARTHAPVKTRWPPR